MRLHAKIRVGVNYQGLTTTYGLGLVFPCGGDCVGQDSGGEYLNDININPVPDKSLPCYLCYSIDKLVKAMLIMQIRKSV